MVSYYPLIKANCLLLIEQALNDLRTNDDPKENMDLFRTIINVADTGGANESMELQKRKREEGEEGE